MASTKMFTKNHHGHNASSTSSFFHQQQAPAAPPPASSSATNQPFDEDITLTQEMHVKMAKKIAQLTKVCSIGLFVVYLLFASHKKRE